MYQSNPSLGHQAQPRLKMLGLFTFKFGSDSAILFIWNGYFLLYLESWPFFKLRTGFHMCVITQTEAFWYQIKTQHWLYLFFTGRETLNCAERLLVSIHSRQQNIKKLTQAFLQIACICWWTWGVRREFCGGTAGESKEWRALVSLFVD